ncbi:MAG: restriction endonuclease subunit S [Spirochaetales bacterium]|nr:restriction endonuclease subunit S [Spirochaetales bacterium]
MTNWKEYKLGELIETVSKTFKFSDKKVVFLNTSDTLEGKVINHNLFEPKKLPGQAKKTIQPNDILYSEIRPANKRYAFVDFDSSNYVVSTKLMVLRVLDEEIISPKYLYYFLTSDEIVSYLQMLAESRSGTFPQIRFEEVSLLDIKLPPINVQNEIVELVASLDDKIELNNKINQELENLAQTLFKQWFIDFEFPNENGKPYKSSGGEMVDSELGEIPKGWEVKMVTDFIEVKDGTHDSPKQCEEGNYLITSKHLKNSFIDFDSAYKISNEDFVNVNKRSKVDKNDILITMIGTVGNLYYVGNEPNYAIKNIGLFKSSTSESFSIYLYEYLKSSFISEYYRVRLAGSTQQYLTLKVLRETPIIYNENIVSAFVDAIKEMRNTVINNSNENQELTNLRDTLLPKLISGELEVADIMAEKA